MTERRDVDKLESLADKLLSASEKVDKEESLSAEEIGALAAIRRAHPEVGQPVVPRWAFLAAAAAVVLSVVGFLASSYLWDSPPGRISLELAMLRVDGTRSSDPWASGDAFRIEVHLSEERFLHLLHVDADGKLEFFFPFYDAGSKTWDYLGHRDNRIPGGADVSIPAEDFPDNLAIDTALGGKEFFIAFASADRVDEAALLEMREELRGEVTRAKQSGAGADVIANQVEELIAGKFPGTQARYAYTVE